jgi:hypothetical protein
MNNLQLKKKSTMSIRNQSRDADWAQDDGGFGAPVDGFPAYGPKCSGS